MSFEFHRESPRKFDSRTLNRKTLNRWTGRTNIAWLKLSGNSLVWEFHRLKLRLFLSQTLWNPQCQYEDWPYGHCSLARKRGTHKRLPSSHSKGLKVTSKWLLGHFLVGSPLAVPLFRASECAKDTPFTPCVREHCEFQSPLLPETCWFQCFFYVRKGYAWVTQSWLPPAPRKSTETGWGAAPIQM